MNVTKNSRLKSNKIIIVTNSWLTNIIQQVGDRFTFIEI